MNDSTETPGTGWADVWIDAQRKYMDAWSGLVRQSGKTTEGSPWGVPQGRNPFLQGLDHWSRMAMSALPEGSRAVGERMLELNKGYLQVAESMWSLVEGARKAADAGTDWQTAWQQQITQLQELMQSAGGKAVPSAGLATFWGMPLQHFRQMASSMSAMPGDVEKSLREGAPLTPEMLGRAMDSMLSAPSLGYTREWQEDTQEWMGYLLDHLQALQDYEAIFAKVGARGFDILSARLLAMAQEGKTFESLREVYNLWVDCGEEAYGELSNTEEFAKVQAHLTNTLMALKHHEQLLMTEVQGALNMPTRRELNTTHCRVHGLRREVRVAAHRIEDLEDAVEELEELRAAVRALEAGAAGSPTAPPKGKAKAKQKGTKKTAKKTAGSGKGNTPGNAGKED
jgi:class III poly(R)-hydroxyalkanoic acid synthase PhaE subunit